MICPSDFLVCEDLGDDSIYIRKADVCTLNRGTTKDGQIVTILHLEGGKSFVVKGDPRIIFDQLIKRVDH